MQLPRSQGPPPFRHGAGALVLLQEDAGDRRGCLPDCRRHLLYSMGDQGSDRCRLRRVPPPGLSQVKLHHPALCRRDVCLLSPRLPLHPLPYGRSRSLLPGQLPDRYSRPPLRGQVRLPDAGEAANRLVHGVAGVGVLPAGVARRRSHCGAHRRQLRPPDHLLVVHSSRRQHHPSYFPRVLARSESCSGEARSRLELAQEASLHHQLLHDHGACGARERIDRHFVLRLSSPAAHLLALLYALALSPGVPVAASHASEVQLLHVLVFSSLCQHRRRARLLVYSRRAVCAGRAGVRLYVLQHLHVGGGSLYRMGRNRLVSGDHEWLDL
mmetsp:Transcript_50605/g.158105  ORF Transcript_50605/g.158105 Transcript_50605/m.158105 type:complete len:326 (+) Transcript_50605:393-1370(+)